jgi:capsular polysaccharide biosynthesis protein
MGRVLARLPATTFESRCVVSESPRFRTGPDVTRPLPFAKTFEVPPMSLREYRQALCVPGQIVLHRNMVLPDSYRHHTQPRLRNRHLQDHGPLFGAPPGGALRDVRRLEGAFFYLDSEFRGHFGHAMTEQLSRLWAWERAKEAEPELRALMAATRGRPQLAPFEPLLYSAAGVPREDLVLVNGPVRVDRLIAATPMFSQPRYVHPAVRETWCRVGAALEAAAPDRTYAQRVFVSRRGGRRSCRNADEVEALFAARDFQIIFPEDFPLPEQVAIFRQAEVIAGFSGSGLFTLALAEQPKRLVMITPDSYRAKNEYLMAAVHGHSLDVVWCESETPMPHDRFWGRAAAAPFTFDHEKEGLYLQHLLNAMNHGAQAC